MEAGPGIMVSLLRDKCRREQYLFYNLNKHACYQLSWNCHDPWHWEKCQDTSVHSRNLLAYCVLQLSKCVAEAKMGATSFPVSGFSTSPGIKPRWSKLSPLFQTHLRAPTYYKMFWNIPGFTRPPCSFESNLIRLCEVGWSGHIFQILPGVFAMKNHERAKCEAQSSHTGFLFHSPTAYAAERCSLIFLAIFTCIPYPSINYFQVSPGLQVTPHPFSSSSFSVMLLVLMTFLITTSASFPFIWVPIQLFPAAQFPAIQSRTSAESFPVAR